MKAAFDELRIKLNSPLSFAYPDLERLSVVGTDASSVSFGALMAQKKNMERYIPCSTRVVQ